MMSKQIKNLDYQEALERLLAAVVPLGREWIPVQQAAGRVPARQVVTPRPFPDTRRSAVDGYALGSVTSADFRLTEILAAESRSRVALNATSAAAVMTGATVPEGAVAVIRVEDATVNGMIVTPKTTVAVGDNINSVGDEMVAANPVLEAGRRLDPVAYSVLCALGLEQVEVYRRPHIGVMITGNELLQPGEQHRPGLVYDCNSFLLKVVLERLGAIIDIRNPVGDSPAEVKRVVEQLGKSCDLVITSGGVSVGQYDFVRPLFSEDGFELVVDRTRIKPGRPLLVARRGPQLFFGMPGYPAAFLVNLFIYLLPVIKKISGWTSLLPRSQWARLTQPVTGRVGRCDLIRLKLIPTDETMLARPLASQLTSHYLNMGDCDALLMLDEETAGFAAEDMVRVIELARALD